MEQKKMNPMDASAQSKQEKALSVFRYLQQLQQIGQKVILQTAQYPWCRSLHSLPEDPDNVRLYPRGSTASTSSGQLTNVLLSVHKPELTACPAPDAELADWLCPGWEDFHNAAEHLEQLMRPVEELALPEQVSQPMTGQEHSGCQFWEERFADAPGRARKFQAWNARREKWQQQQMCCDATRKLFSDLYNAYLKLERYPETLELVAADGFLRDRDQPEIDHPVLTCRVRLLYDPVENTLWILESDTEAELYPELFQHLDGIWMEAVSMAQEELRHNEYHPLDGEPVSVFLKSFVHRLSGESMYSEAGLPQDWQKTERILLYRNPCLILRERKGGAQKAIDRVLENIEQTGYVPDPLADLLEGGRMTTPQPEKERSLAEQLAEVGGESTEILLPKPANPEQLEIVRRMDQYHAVVVQGPPGTGKTHTDANVAEYLLSQGKSVLITSHTQKALRVLKEKLDPEIQDLCVSMLEDSHADLEKSVDGIVTYLSQHTASSVKKEQEALAAERSRIMEEQAAVRQQLFDGMQQECRDIVYADTPISPAQAADFLYQNKEDLSYIPGEVTPYAPLPLGKEELEELYRSNAEEDAADAAENPELLPAAEEIPTLDAFTEACAALAQVQPHLNELGRKKNWQLCLQPGGETLQVTAPFGSLTLCCPSAEKVEQLRSCAQALPWLEPWMQDCALDGKKGGAAENRWQRLIEQIQDTCALADQLTEEEFGHSVEIVRMEPDLAEVLEDVAELYRDNGHIGRLLRMLHPELDAARKCAVVDGHPLQNEAECRMVLRRLELLSKRSVCGGYWNSLIASCGMPAFAELDPVAPERVAANYIPDMQRSLTWFAEPYAALLCSMQQAGLPEEQIFARSPMDSEQRALGKVLMACQEDIPVLCEAFSQMHAADPARALLARTGETLRRADRADSALCRVMAQAAQTQDAAAYGYGCIRMGRIADRVVQTRRRTELLDRLAADAPQWAEAIRAHAGIHGHTEPPARLEDAWKWKQYGAILDQMAADSFPQLQARSRALSQEYRRVTAQLAAKSAWYHLLVRTEQDMSMKQDLIGWKQTVRKIGKGTGKNAPIYRAKARELMARCQKAVPAWIMPTGKALESLNPAVNQFDVIIMDEASQSDISALALLYMGKKLIIVGDDQQVSPLAVGLPTDRIQALKTMCLSDKIPNAHLYDPTTSIYDLAATTFQPLILREHFRCVPEIIGFSNWLSYNGKIKPLRDGGSSTLLPAVVNYKVEDGWRVGKANPAEARATTALLQACLEQPEYDGKTFGVISMLGEDQVRKLQTELYTHLDARQVRDRRILCGTASDFQGDERDVIFLNLVDCANGNGPVFRQTFGVEDACRKRYNVAASRARDQLWVVHSFDPALDLKTGDIRRMLIDYAKDPAAVIGAEDSVEAKSESPFEAAVARALKERGYHLVQQWRVGAYRLDLAAICDGKKIAIECDGERWHSGEAKIREDLERQTILERLGWQFIRIRGSVYYRDPEAAIDWVVSELARLGIQPEGMDEVPQVRQTELLQRVQRRARELLESWSAGEPEKEPQPETPALTEETADEASAALKPYQLPIDLPFGEEDLPKR